MDGCGQLYQRCVQLPEERGRLCFYLYLPFLYFFL